MSRRLVGGTVVAATVLAGTMSSFGADLLPREGCARLVADPKGDAKVNYNNVVAGQPVNHPNGASIAGLDITGTTVRVTDSTVEAYTSINDIPTVMGSTESAFMYDTTFQLGEKFFKFSHVLTNKDHPTNLHPPGADKYPKAAGGNSLTSLTVNLVDVTGRLDKDKNWVVVAATRAEVERALGTPIVPGDLVKAITAVTTQYTGPGTQPKPFAADVSDSKAPEATYEVFDDTCFAPPAGVLSAFTAAPATVQFGDATALSAKLVDSAGAPAAGKPVRFTVDGETPLTGTTNSAGVAKVTYVPTKKSAGTHAVTVEFLGDDTVGKAKVVGNVAVKAETTTFGPLIVAKPSATARTVTATLSDDDKRVVAGQKVDWYVNGKKVATVATDSKGRSVFKAAKAGQTVQAKYAGATGKYTAAASKAQKV